MNSARDNAINCAYGNVVLSHASVLDRNNANASGGDILIGYLANPTDRASSMTFGDPTRYNSLKAHVHRDNVRNGSIALYFARIFGYSSTDGWGEATATARDGINGYKITQHSGNAQ